MRRGGTPFWRYVDRCAYCSESLERVASYARHLRIHLDRVPFKPSKRVYQ